MLAARVLLFVAGLNLGAALVVAWVILL